eukprot:CAMPEP_0174835120 /NCGR_PEP_ID=MMETSP1114-20130205/5245_1 /TAXON_ID=312471 /ORGANISM="Neobodo designis, Strain CCAP 1951/1" /LENGTH=944 /DNA_ID=CAMNT_0016069065 /DNA_START=153 /DNA_END=2987 /DNA_ORIENTATION=-
MLRTSVSPFFVFALATAFALGCDAAGLPRTTNVLIADNDTTVRDRVRSAFESDVALSCARALGLSSPPHFDIATGICNGFCGAANTTATAHIVVARAYEVAHLVMLHGYKLLTAVEGANTVHGLRSFSHVGGVIIAGRHTDPSTPANASHCTRPNARIAGLSARSVSGHLAQLGALQDANVAAIDEADDVADVVRRVADGGVACGFLRSDEFTVFASANTTDAAALLAAVEVLPPPSRRRADYSLAVYPSPATTPLYPDWSVVVSPEFAASDGAAELVRESLLVYRGATGLRFSRALDHTDVFELMWRFGVLPRAPSSSGGSDDNAVGLAAGLAGAGVIALVAVAAIVYAYASATRRHHDDVRTGLRANSFGVSISTRDQRYAPTDPSAPVTIVFTDIQASTTLWSAVPAEMGPAIDVHHALIRKLLQQYCGYEVKTIGDSFMCAFADTDNAVAFACELQEQLHASGSFDPVLDQIYAEDVAERAMQSFAAYSQLSISRARSASASHACDADPANSQNADRLAAYAAQCQEVLDQHAQGHDAEQYAQSGWRGLRVRVGIHVGKAEVKLDPTTGGFDYYGTVVNTAARVENVAHGGQVLVTPDVVKALSASGAEMYTTLANSCADMPCGSSSAYLGIELSSGSCGPRTVAATHIGAHALAGIAQPVPLLQLLPHSLAARSFLPPRTAATERDFATAQAELELSKEPVVMSQFRSLPVPPGDAGGFSPPPPVTIEQPTLPTFGDGAAIPMPFESSELSASGGPNTRLPHQNNMSSHHSTGTTLPPVRSSVGALPSNASKLCLSANPGILGTTDWTTDGDRSIEFDCRGDRSIEGVGAAGENSTRSNEGLKRFVSQLLARSGRGGQAADRLATVHSDLRRLIAPLPAEAKQAFLRAVTSAWRVDAGAAPNQQHDDTLLMIALHRAIAGLDRRRATQLRRSPAAAESS